MEGGTWAGMRLGRTVAGCAESEACLGCFRNSMIDFIRLAFRAAMKVRRRRWCGPARLEGSFYRR